VEREKVKEVKDIWFVYLGYTFKRNRHEAHIRDRIKKAAVMGVVWAIRKRRFGEK